MPFSNILPLTQLVIPDGAPQTPGSGSTVIGGPLPPELVAAGYVGSAIIWYSAPNSAGNYKYAFLAHTDSGFVFGDLISGFTDSAGVVHVISDNTDLTFFVKNTLSVGDGGTNQGTMRYDIVTNQLVINAYPSNPANVMCGNSNLRSDGGDGYLTYNGGTTIDKWQSVAISGTAGGKTYTGVVDYKISYDRVVDLRFTLAFSAGTTGGNVTVSNVIPAGARPSASPNNIFPHGIYDTNPITTGGPIEFNYNGAGGIVLINLSTTVLNVAGSCVYVIDKPTF